MPESIRYFYNEQVLSCSKPNYQKKEQVVNEEEYDSKGKKFISGSGYVYVV
ncbi:MAG: hypothetical protein GY795_03605 [Desulfobacterales bacterium]|nr:hypothetical protein [Desulfobacterales bacterium]